MRSGKESRLKAILAAAAEAASMKIRLQSEPLQAVRPETGAVRIEMKSPSAEFTFHRPS